jgi:FkbM family methyltransferase
MLEANEDWNALAQEFTRSARQANPGADIEVIWKGMWVRRVGTRLFPDPDLNAENVADWSKWLARADKYLRDAHDYWFYLYHPGDGDVIVDIGAGRGEDVFAFSQAVGHSGKVWGIEPHPISFHALTTMCELNGLTNVITLNYACTEVPQSLRIETMPVWESNYVRAGEATATSYPVTGLPFDRIAAEHRIDRIDFLKMNIEGAERNALPGCRDALARAQNVCVAAHDFRADRGEGEQFRTLEFVRAFLSESGFELITRDTDPRYYVPYHVHGKRRN